MQSLYIDPSFHGTGISVINSADRVISFVLIGTNEPKKSLERYYQQSRMLANRFHDELLVGGLGVSSRDSIFMEAPIMGAGRYIGSSNGLHMLQYAYLDQLQSYGFPYIRSITPAYIKGAVTREFKRRGILQPKDKIKSRNDLARLVVHDLKSDAWQFSHEDLLYRKAYDDCSTSFLFWYLSQPERDNKSFPRLNFIEEY